LCFIQQSATFDVNVLESSSCLLFRLCDSCRKPVIIHPVYAVSLHASEEHSGPFDDISQMLRDVLVANSIASDAPQVHLISVVLSRRLPMTASLLIPAHDL